MRVSALYCVCVRPCPRPVGLTISLDPSIDSLRAPINMSERSHVLVLGARGGSNGTCPEQFVRRLLGLDDEPDPSKAAAAPQQQGPFHWAIATKYYRAELAVHVRHAEPGAASASSLEAAVSLEGPAADGQEGEGEGPHGVILVVDGRQAAELEAWRPWCVHAFPSRIDEWMD